ncbi:hypothetical protein, partial [Buttiauxella noackiae]|uniref:hypothetical protein n=1 Tax=Buttiauxella noackiae TaxID=82992 RepID=UPI001AE04BA9
AHNPYSIFDENDVKKAKITLLQTNIYDEVVKEFELSQPFLNITLIAGFITIEAILKNEYRKKHQLLMINER